MKKLKFPTPYTVLMLVIVLAATLTFFLPSGSYSSLQYDKTQDAFLVRTTDSAYTLPATQKNLNQLGIAIQLNKFKEEKIKKPIAIPNTYVQTAPHPQGAQAVLFAPIKGIYDSIEVILFVLVLGGFIGVFNSSGALNSGVGYLAHKLKGRERILIILLTILLAFGGTSFGLAEETLAFYPMLVPIFLAAGYDLMVPLAVIYIGSNVGSMASTTNPFAVIIASDAAGVDWTSGLIIRLIALALCVLISIIYIIRYAEKVRKDPKKSIVYGVPLPQIYAGNQPQTTAQLQWRTKIELLIFSISFLVMIIGVSQWEWWFQEMTALFLVASVLIAIFQRCGEEAFVAHFVAGARDLLGVAFIIGIARGVSFILNDGQISGTILNYATHWVQGMSPMLFLPMLLLVFGFLSLFIASSSGMAVLTMPIIGALASVVGVDGHKVVSAYLFGMGIMSFLTPTGLILPSLAMVNINYKQWLRFCTPLVLIFTLLLTFLLWI